MKIDAPRQKVLSSEGLLLRIWTILVFMILFWALPQDVSSASLTGVQIKHQGVCPNMLNANLWVDAQSTCERECNVDEVRRCYSLNYL